jgi:hypothetical protein
LIVRVVVEFHAHRFTGVVVGDECLRSDLSRPVSSALGSPMSDAKRPIISSLTGIRRALFTQTRMGITQMFSSYFFR